MCQNAASSIAATLANIEPTLVSVETILGVINTPEGQASIKEFNALQAALANWTQGTSAETIIQLINDFTAGFNTLVATIPVVPPEVVLLVDVISAGLVTVIGLLKGNSPAPAPAGGGTVTPSAQKAYAAKVMADTEAQVSLLVPGYKLTLKDRIEEAAGDHMVVANEYKNHWNKQIAAAAKVDPKYAQYKCDW